MADCGSFYAIRHLDDEQAGDGELLRVPAHRPQGFWPQRACARQVEPDEPERQRGRQALGHPQKDRHPHGIVHLSARAV